MCNVNILHTLRILYTSQLQCSVNHRMYNVMCSLTHTQLVYIYNNNIILLPVCIGTVMVSIF